MKTHKRIEELKKLGILKEDAKLESDSDGSLGIHERYIKLDLCAPNTCGCCADIYLYLN